MLSSPVWAIVPAKSLARGKSRLRPVMADAERARFARALLENTLSVLRAGPLDGVLVATDGDDVAEVAAAYGARVRRDRGASTLAAVVDGALAEVSALGARAAIVVMADLPRIAPGDVAALVAALEGCDVALVRDHLGQHTNALAVAPPTAIGTCFGRPDSFVAHRAAAQAAGLTVAILDNERLAFDVDAPADHAALTEPRPGAGT
jgi:2-phospho-L-lactate guanylyltransferase